MNLLILFKGPANSCDFMRSMNKEYEDCEDESSNKDTALGNSKIKSPFSGSNTLLNDNSNSKFDMTSSIKHQQEEKENDENKSKISKEEKKVEKKKIEVKKLSKEEIMDLIDKKRSELDIKIFDMVTKNQVEEKKLEENYEAETDEEQKGILLKNLENSIKLNEDVISEMKE